MLKTGAYSTLFPCVNWVSYWKEYFLQIKTYQVRKVILIQIGKFMWVTKNMIVSKETFHVKTGAPSTLSPCENWVSIWKEYFWQHLSFKMEIVSVCSKQAHSAEFKMYIYLLKECHLCFKLDQLAHCLLMRI
jgi:hypothetical protein